MSTCEKKEKGVGVLRNPWLNRGLAFSEQQRDALGLRGLLPAAVSTRDQQVERWKALIAQQPTPLMKYITLDTARMIDEALYFQLVMENVEEYMPLIYTPTVGEACQKFGHIYRAHRGLYICAEDRGHVRDIVANVPNQKVDIIVVTDGQRILGLGDLGACGMGIPIGKLALYTACAGVNPQHTLPVTLDVGTNNEEFLKDPLYIGQRHKRVDDETYYALIEEFIAAVRERWPNVLIQFEDFGNANAFALLDQFRHRYCCFSDDIQGTGSIVVAGLITAARAKKKKLSDERVLFFGAGEAGTGSADQLVVAMNVLDGTPVEEARRKMFLFDIDGLVTTRRTTSVPGHDPYAKDMDEDKDLLSCIRKIRPTAIIGLSTVGGAFTEEVLKLMGEINEQPVIFPLSNPNSKSECTPHAAYRATNGRALVATGSPFPVAVIDSKLIVPRQGNNAYIYPAVGLAGLLGQLPSIEDEDLLIASRTVADMVTDEDIACGALYPPFERVREVCRNIAANIIINAKAKGLCTIDLPQDVKAWVEVQMYRPIYE